MKQVSRLLALLLALCMAFACALGESETADQAPLSEAEDPVLLTMDGEAYPLSLVDAYIQDLLANDYLESESDYDTALEFIIQNKLINDKIVEWGLDQFTEEEEAAFRTEIEQTLEAQKDSIIDSYISYYLTEDSEEARAALSTDAEQYYEYLKEDYISDAMLQDSYDRLLDRLYKEQGQPVTEERIADTFAEEVEMQKEQYEGNVFLYELYKNYYGAEILYQPAGYRGVLHILLSADQALLDAYQDAQNAYEESVSSEEGAGDADALLNAVSAARQAVLDSEKAAIDDIYARLAKGESFESLLAVYGEDEGMKDEETLKTGYEVHKESLSMGWDPAFIDGAFQEKMQHPGDVSDPVVSSFGVHIIYYLRDVPAGPVEMTDEIRDEIRDYLESASKSEILSRELETTWREAHQIVLNTEAIEQAKAAVAAQQAEVNNAEGADDDLSSLSPDELQNLLSQLATEAVPESEEEAPQTQEAPAE